MNEKRRQVHQLKQRQVCLIAVPVPKEIGGRNLDLFLVSVGHTIDPSRGLGVGHLLMPCHGNKSDSCSNYNRFTPSNN